MSITAPNVVLVEDDAADAHLIHQLLQRQLPQAVLRHAATRREYVDLLGSFPVDVVLSDGSVPGCEGIEAYYLARTRDPQVSFIFVSGSGEDQDLPGLQGLGVTGFLTKDALDQLAPAIRSALQTRYGTGVQAGDRQLLAGYELLVQSVIELSQAPDRTAIMSAVCSAARRLTGADGATFMLREGDAGHYAHEDAIAPLWLGQRGPLASSISGWSILRRQPAVVDDIYTDPRVGPGQFVDTFVRSLVAVPVRAPQPEAAIGVYWAHPHQPGTGEIKLLQALADATAVTLATTHERQTLAAQVRERTQELDALTYAVSHDLRAPIRHLEGFTRMLLQDAAGLTSQARVHAERIAVAGQQLRDMTGGLLVLSRTTRAPVHRQWFDLAQLARDVVREVSGEWEHDVDFISPAQALVDGDQRLLRTALENLLRNAWKFTAHTLQPVVEFGVDAHGDELAYYVADNGAGFETGSAERLFGVFARLHRESGFPGTGIGLAAVKRIVSKHGGTVQASGTPGRGARFWFTLPPES